MRRFGVRKEQSERIRGLLPDRVGRVGMTARDNRLFMEAVLYRYHAAIIGGLCRYWLGRYLKSPLYLDPPG